MLFGLPLGGGGGGSGSKPVRVSEIWRSQVQVPFWPLTGVILGRPKFSSTPWQMAMFINSQLFCLFLPVGSSHINYFVIFCHWPRKAPLGEWSIKIFFFSLFTSTVPCPLCSSCNARLIARLMAAPKPCILTSCSLKQKCKMKDYLKLYTCTCKFLYTV